MTDGHLLGHGGERQRSTQRDQKSLAQRDGKKQAGRGAPGESPFGGGYQRTAPNLRPVGDPEPARWACRDGVRVQFGSYSGV